MFMKKNEIRRSHVHFQLDLLSDSFSLLQAIAINSNERKELEEAVNAREKALQ